MRVPRLALFALFAPFALLTPAPLVPSAPLAPLAPGAVQRQTPLGASLLTEIQAIKAIDNHAHVVRPVPDDHDYDALPFSLLDPPPPGTEGGPLKLRGDAPGFVRAWKALFAYPYDDATGAHLKQAAALKQKAMAAHGAAYPAWVLDKQGVEIVLANRVAMAPDLPQPRFRWVPFADPFFYPLDNSAAKAANRDYAAFYPAEEKLLQQYMRESGVSALPATLADYCRTVVTPTLERHKAGGAVAEKLESAYLRRLDFGPADESAASRTYAQFVKGGVPPAADYKALQDYLFAYTAREAGR